MPETDSKFIMFERDCIESSISQLFEFILDLKYKRKMETRKLSKSILFAETVKLNFDSSFFQA